MRQRKARPGRVALAKAPRHLGQGIRVSPVWLADIRKQYERGDTMQAIADRVGRTDGRIWQLAKQHGWQRPASKPKAAPPSSSPSSGDAARAEAPRRSPKRRPRPKPSKAAAPSDSGALPLGAAASAGDQDAPTTADLRRAPLAAQRHKTEKAERDAKFRSMWEAKAPYLELRTAFGLVSDHAVLIKAVRMGLAARHGDKVPPSTGTSRKQSTRGVSLALAAKRLAQERIAIAAALAPADLVAAARMYLQRKGVVIYAASVTETGANPEMLKVDNRPMLPAQMVEHAVRQGFDPGRVVPSLRQSTVAPEASP